MIIISYTIISIFTISIPSSVEVDENEVFVQVKGKRRVSNVKIGKEDLVLDKNIKLL